eukprot:CAMPEP_0184659122 /NCGR_PEP_ID=MMETSP0308-20130426/28293_1 /TAXON_ID=38269 /ORGANISM="Gloeochaete witrockiana, Strain SAG 46.84" /LENGTH=53 /DNA_ID=CAMNT_0027098673 /DNA_START=169 /DNA_END=330 /DNA_ORIENTATION=+
MKALTTQTNAAIYDLELSRASVHSLNSSGSSKANEILEDLKLAVKIVKERSKP